MREKKYSPFVNRYIIMALALAAAACLICGIYMLADSMMFIKNAEEVTGTVTDVYIRHRSKKSDICNAWVSYTVDGTVYTYYYQNIGRGYFINKSDYKGMEVKLLYSRKNPAKVRSARKPYGKSAFIVFVGIAAAAGCVYLVKRNRFYEELINHGLVVEAVVTDVENHSQRRGNRYTYGSGYGGKSHRSVGNFEEYYSIVICEWVNTMTGDSYEFRSKLVKEFMGLYIGQTVRVYVDPNDFSKYFVDIDDLLMKPFVS